MTLTEKGIKIFFEEKTVLFQRKQEQKAIINPESITAKTLFYSNENQKQIDMLKTTLMQQNLTRIQSRLRTKGLSTGICVLLYGAPGTGKTESVYQLAKATGRQIIPVDISKTKSCWSGKVKS